MIGAVILTHSFIGRELIATAEYLVGPMRGIQAVSIDNRTDALEARKIISDAIQKVDQGKGVLVLVDLFGGVPSNLAFSFFEEGKIEVVTGVNLPMILTFWNMREHASLAELAKSVQLAGARSISVAKKLREAAKGRSAL